MGEKRCSGYSHGKAKVYTFKYADYSHQDGWWGRERLKRLLKIMEKFVRKVKMEINVDKTKILECRVGCLGPQRVK